MTPDRTDANPDDNAEHGVLDESGNLDTASITILGGHIAQVSVDLPVSTDDDIDDDVIEDEIPIEDGALPVLDGPRDQDADERGAEIAHAPHVEELPTGDIILEPHDGSEDTGVEGSPEVLEAEVVDEGGDAHADADQLVAEDARDDDGYDASSAEGAVPSDEHTGDASASDVHEDELGADSVHDVDVVDDVELFEADAAEPTDAAAGADEGQEALTHAPWTPAPETTRESDANADAPAPRHAEGYAAAPERQADVAAAPAGAPAAAATTATAGAAATTPAAGAATPATGAATTTPAAPAAPPAPVVPAAPAAATTTGSVPTASAAAPATGSVPTAPAAASATGPVPTTRAARAATGAIGTIPLTRRSVHHADEAARAADEAARVDRAHAMERVRTPASEVALTSKRIGQIEDSRESSDLLTADRLLDPRQIARPEPEGLWQQLVYSVSGHRINLGDGRKARQRKELDRRIAAPLVGGARFVPVLSRKGGVGKTTVTSLLGMALADARDDRIIAVDANPDRGTLADRVGGADGHTVRDLVRSHESMAGFNDVSSVVSRDATRLDVLASETDPRVSEAFSDDDYRQVADVATHYYSIVLTDTGTGIVHSVMGATLELADTLVIVAGLSVDEARLASETLTWLETNGYAARVRDAVVVLNNSRPGAPLVRESELEKHFRSRVRSVIRMPYDPRIAAGSAIAFRDLDPATRQAARELAAAVVEGLRAPVAAA